MTERECLLAGNFAGRHFYRTQARKREKTQFFRVKARLIKHSFQVFILNFLSQISGKILRKNPKMRTNRKSELFSAQNGNLDVNLIKEIIQSINQFISLL